MRVLVTGSAGRLAQVLVPRLLAHPRVTAVTGVDLRPDPRRHPRYRFLQRDLSRGLPPELLAGHDALVHLAFVVMRSQLGRRAYDRALLRALNVEASLALLEAAGAAGLGCALFLSSAAVYGAWPDNPPRLREDAPLRGIPGFAYAEDKIAVEQALDGLARRWPATRYLSLRAHAILGPHAQPYLKGLLTAPVTARIRPPPHIQCVHETDVVQAILLALERDVRGPFNLAADPPVTLPDLRRAVGRRGLALPLPLLRWGQRLAWRLTPRAEDPAWLEGARWPLVLDCRRAHDLLGWRPRHHPERCARESLRP